MVRVPDQPDENDMSKDSRPDSERESKRPPEDKKPDDGGQNQSGSTFPKEVDENNMGGS